MTPELSVIVVTYRSRDTIAACLSSVAAESRRLSLELAIVDNSSPDDTVAVARAAVASLGLEHCTSIHALSENLGFAAANNFAAERLRGPPRRRLDQRTTWASRHRPSAKPDSFLSQA